MNKAIIPIVIGLVVIIGGALAYVLLQPDATPRTQEVSTATPETSTPSEMTQPDGAAATMQPGAYKEYSKADVESTAGTKLLFFHAPWCPQCRSMEASIKQGLPDGVTVFKVDYDSNQALRQQYGVTLQTTFVKIDDDGNKISSYVAYDDPIFSAVERELLK